MERRLAAILAADVAGYSLLMNTDEDATYMAWRSARAEVIDPVIATGQGRIVKHTGDGFLAEFPTVLAAVKCAVNIQREMSRRNENLENGRRFEFRIGINLGDIIVDSEDIHGDGVNIAARLEAIAEAGGVCISDDVYRQVRNKPGFEFEDLGEHSVKNIKAPIQVYRVSMDQQVDSASDTPGAANPRPVDSAVNETESQLEAMLENMTASKQQPPTMMVGRESEKASLADAYREAQQGNGNIALIRGEPGIGKSCLASTFAEELKSESTLVVYGQCHETLGSPPFWPWLQILRNLQLADDSLGLSPAAIFGDLAAAEKQQLNKPSSLLSSDVGSDQFLLFSKIANVLAQYASQHTLILVIDDLHWADKSSLLLLSHICRRLSEQAMLVIGTYRDIEVTRKHPLFESLGEISRQANLRRIPLKGLSEQDVTGFIENTVSETLSPEILKSLYEKTDGNPLFVSEVARILQQEDFDRSRGQMAIEIPEGIQEAIGRRLNQLSQQCNELLTQAAVIGRKFSLPVLNQLLPEAEHFGSLEILEEALSRGIVEQRPNTVAEFQFCHVLTRDILYDELSLAKKIILHKKVADALVLLRDGDSEVSAGEIARHYYHAIQGGQSDAAVDYAIEAAEHAIKLSAFDEAREYYELAMDVFNLDERRYAKLKTEVLFHIVECVHAVGSATQVTAEACEVALRAARQTGQFDIFSQAACRLVYVERRPNRANQGLKYIQEALSYLPEDDLVNRANLLAYHSMSLCFNGHRSEAERIAFEALAVAQRCDDNMVLCNSMCMALLVLRGRPEKLSERIRLGEQAVELSVDIMQTSGHLPILNDPKEWLIMTYQELGDMDKVKALIQQLEASVEQVYSFKGDYFSAGAKANQALFEGRWQQAEALIETAAELGASKLDGSAEGVYGVQMFMLNRELGRLPMVQGALKRMLEKDNNAVWAPGLLATYTELGMLDEAREIFEQLAANDFRPLGEGELFLTCLVYMIDACVELNDAGRAAALYQRLVPYSGQMLPHATAVSHGPADMYLGMLSSVMNNLDEAQKLFGKAAELCEQSAPNMWQAHIMYRHAQVLKRHNFSGGRTKFDELVAEARATAQAMGMVNLLAKLEKLETDSGLENADPDGGLTPRELEVLQLIAQGKSNKLIASELNRSLATVATHVRAILNKTHTANRTEAAAFAAENKLFRVN
jgi:class 3 adenylate cyclase/DNA-binding CsgD family transcriptional regulator/tetratricopeptide (TPR) repeat protein